MVDEERLLELAAHIADRPDADADPLVPRAQRIQEIADRLIADNECLHDAGWHRIRGGHNCSECGNRARLYILECQRCELRACVRCVQTRL